MLDSVPINVLKTKRYICPKNLDTIRALPCCICGDMPSDPDHIKTVGSGGGDNLSNLWPLCRMHHIERHQSGIATFYRRYETRIVMSREEQGLPHVKIKNVVD